MSVMCPDCGHLYKDHDNQFGKICIHCGCYMAPRIELPIVTKNKHKRALLLQEARQLVAKRAAGGSNANHNR